MRRYNLNQEQQAQVIHDVQEVGKRLLGLAFEKPENDQANIRHHAYLRGKFDMLTDILNDIFPDPEPVNPSEE
jgi:hypothetical protein